jgi:hypothetical protein
MELEVTQTFPTLIGQLLVPDADAMNQDLQALIMAEEAKCSRGPVFQKRSVILSS